MGCSGAHGLYTAQIAALKTQFDNMGPKHREQPIFTTPHSTSREDSIFFRIKSKYQTNPDPTLSMQLLPAHFHLPSRISSPKKICLGSGFVKSPVTARNPLRLAGTPGGKFMCFERNWLRRDLNVIGFGLIGWLAPSSIPAIGGKSLSGLFFESIGTELAHFPTPPPLTSQFWLWLVTWHLGLFICLTFGQIGFKGRTEEYF
ncbi:hypothetical protein OIU76_015746 [Salix suchowensis]|nr:hypothetical protein OIU76_015746 [Salix suchowensis]KAJ6346433.1 hypothetical protein OIU78_008965 [Salix suchowensis]